MNMKNKIYKSDYNGYIDIPIRQEIKVKLSTNDIYNWFDNCYNKDTLLYFKRIIQNKIDYLNNPNEYNNENDILG